MMEKDDYVGRILTGRITSGVVRINDRVHGLRETDSGVVKIEEGRVRDCLIIFCICHTYFVLRFSPQLFPLGDKW